MEYNERRIIANTDELAALVAAFESGTPIRIDVDEIEPGHDPGNHRQWAVVASTKRFPLNEAGELAGPGEKIAATEPDEDGTRHLLATPVLILQSRKLAVPGQVGPVARAADPYQRREDARDEAERGESAALYLMELLEAVENLREELEAAGKDTDQILHPAARRALALAANSMEAVRGSADEATRYGEVCELLRIYDIDEHGADIEDGQPCDVADLSSMLVELPGAGYEELGCPIHAKLAVERLPGTTAKPNPHA